MIAAHIEDGQAHRSDHEDDRRPGGEPGQHVSCSAGSEGSLRALATEGASEVSRAALLQEDDSDKEETHDDVQDNDEVEENLHCESCFPNPVPVGPGRRVHGAEEGT